jgi:hypothetical protein
MPPASSHQHKLENNFRTVIIASRIAVANWVSRGVPDLQSQSFIILYLGRRREAERYIKTQTKPGVATDLKKL